MAWKDTKKNKKKKKEKLVKKALKAIFGKTLPLVIILVLLLGAALGLLYHQSEPVRNFVDSLGLFTTTTRVPFIDPEGDEMAVHYIDVGQGDATLLQTPKGSVLIDCSEKEYGDDIVAYLSEMGVTELEYFIITHPDADHMGAAAYILENITVKNFVMNGQEKNTVFFSNALDVMEEKNISGTIVAPGDVLTVGALQMKILAPHRIDYSEAEWNNASIVIHATYGHRSFLFTGDAEEDAEEDLLRYHASELDCDVFQAGHHGSRTSNSPELLQKATPEFVIISCGEGNSYGHPHQEALDAFEDCGATVYRTDKMGTIVFITDGETLTKK